GASGSARRQPPATSVIDVPDDDLPRLAATGGTVAGRVEDDVVQLPDLPVERLAVLAGAGVPVVDLTVPVGRREEAARRVERHGEEVRAAGLVPRDRDAVRVEGEEGQLPAGGTGESAAVGRDGDHRQAARRSAHLDGSGARGGLTCPDRAVVIAGVQG